MLIRPAEESFLAGIEAFGAGRRLEALARFEAALALERQLGASRAQPRYLSYYGLCLALEAQRTGEGLGLCRDAVQLEFYNADLYCNLARVLVAAKRKKEAHQVLRDGLKWEHGHPGIQRELRSLGTRRKPVLRFLSRQNPINVLLGQMIHSPGTRKRA